MTDPTSISPKPEIKCYGENNKLCNMRLYTTTKTTLKKLRRLTDEELLWTGESVYCICSQNVEQLRTVRDENDREITT
jgi:hypothetical protein